MRGLPVCQTKFFKPSKSAHGTKAFDPGNSCIKRENFICRPLRPADCPPGLDFANDKGAGEGENQVHDRHRELIPGGANYTVLAAG